MWDERFEKTCPGCDNSEGLAPPAQPLQDKNKEDYPLECPKCGLQWAPGQRHGWPEDEELVDSSIRDVLLAWGQNPRAEAEEQARRTAQAAKAAELRANPPTLAEAFPLPWGVHKSFKTLLVPLEDIDKPHGCASDDEQDKKFCRVICDFRTDERAGISERMARANALLIASLCGAAVSENEEEAQK